MGSLLSSSSSSSLSNSVQQTGSGTTVLNSTNDGGSGGSYLLDSFANPLTKLQQDDSTNKQTPNLDDLVGRQQSGVSLMNDTTATTLLDQATTNGTKPLLLNENSDNFRLNLFGTYVYPFKWLTLPTLYSWLAPLSSLAMIIGCVMPYVPQYATIHKKQNCSGFSTFVCLTLLIANILRVAFWFGHRFELPLLIQSIIMLLAQILLLELCVRVKRQNAGTMLKKRTLFGSGFRFFWRWTDLFSYLEFLCFFTIALGLAMYFLIDCTPFVETIGYLALVTESMLGLPQVIKNYRNKSVVGMSLSMVLMWLGGDMFKTGYFIANRVPFQFWLCGLLQITIDLLILFQVCLFRDNSPMKKNSQADDSPKEMMAI